MKYDTLAHIGRCGPTGPQDDDGPDNLDAEMSIEWYVPIPIGSGYRLDEVGIIIDLHGLGEGDWEWTDYRVHCWRMIGWRDAGMLRAVPRSDLDQWARDLLDRLLTEATRERDGDLSIAIDRLWHATQS